MKLLIKNLHNESFTVECDGEDTVKVLKEKIAAKDDLREKYDPELLKLLYTGNVMDDEETVDSFSIKADGFLVLVKQTPGKPKPPPKKKPNPYPGFNNNMGGFGSNSFMQNPFNQNAFGNQPFGQHGFKQNAFGQQSLYPGGFGQESFQAGGFGQESFQAGGFGQESFQAGGFGQNAFKPNEFGQQSHVPATQTPNTGLQDTAPEAFSTAEDREEALQMLLSMGFDREKSEKALRASFYNLETAVEYITTDTIPNTGSTPAVPQATGPGLLTGGLTGHGNQPTPPATRRQGGEGGMGANLQQMRQMLQQNPEQLQVLKQAIQGEHPEIAQMIDENPQAFLDLLNQGAGSTDSPLGTGTGGTGGIGGQGRGGTITVNLSAQEQQTIDRLQDMGFDRSRAIEAFLACDRNENLAINYLLNSFD